MKGLLLAFQFFTVLPINKELPMDKKHVTTMYASLPWIGVFIGMIQTLMFTLSDEIFMFSPLLTAILLVVTGVICTGGLHLDGWADTADAFFSYQKIDKRHDILDDPRLGAFGAMALILYVMIKVGILYEAIVQGVPMMFFLCVIPFVARACLTIVFVTTPPAKERGIAAFLKGKIHTRPLLFMSIVYLVLALIFIGYFLPSLRLSTGIILMIGMSILLFQRWMMKHFGGISGDLAGAYIEGMEVALWFVVLSLL